MIWRSARTWRYVAHDALEGIVLPKRRKVQRFFFTPEEVRRIMAATEGPQRTFCWLAAETGMRAGGAVRSADRRPGPAARIDSGSTKRLAGKIQTPKSENSVRTFALSPQLVEHLRGFVDSWRPNDVRLVFASRNGTPWDGEPVGQTKVAPAAR